MSIVTALTGLLIAGSIGWAVLLVVAPLLPVSIAGPLYLFGSHICHQLAERSFHVDGAQLPVCARCFGIYCGAAAAGVWAPSAAMVMTRERVLLVAAALPTAVTVGLEWAGSWQPSNLVRFLAGGAAGVVVALVVFAAIAQGRRDARERARLAPH